MTRRERAAAAARWRRIARAFERVVRDSGGYGQGIAWSGLCAAADGAGISEEPIEQFAQWPLSTDFVWPKIREGDDCRVIAAGLIAAMYETGEFDE